MEIKAKGYFDFESVKALAHLSFYKKRDPKKTLISRLIILTICFMVFVRNILFYGFNTFLLIMLAFAMLYIFIECFMFFIFPRAQYKSLAKMKDAENEYTFRDDKLNVVTKSNEYNGEAEIEYSLIIKVMETTQYLFLFQNNMQIFIVDKSTIVGGTIEDIRSKFSSFLNTKYVVCKY